MTDTYPLTLGELIAPWCDISTSEAAHIAVCDLQLDSRQVRPQSIFVAIKGHASDGRAFIPAAVEKGASAVLAQADDKHLHGTIDRTYPHTPIIYIEKLNRCLSALALRRYPLTSNQLIAVTGTNGKTTITQLIAQWLELVDKKAAVMGTTGNGFLSDLQPAVNTTGSAIDIAQTLSHLQDCGAQYTALEVSSHGLVQGRVSALPFKVGLFSNLSRDHLDYHGSMQEYAKAKMSLFTEHHCQQAVINLDDKVGLEWATHLREVIGVSLTEPHPKLESQVYATSVEYSEQGISLSFSGCFGDGTLTAPLIGQFNASNLLMALTSLMALGFNKSQLLACATQLKPVIGRMELFQAPSKAKVVIDYAHTPDALEKALSALRVHCQGQLWVIFGCGGDRDRGKRPMMAEIAERLADRTILTDDNPRSESPAAIIEDMKQGLNAPHKAVVEHNRFRALAFALEQASENDIVLLAGKGHEDYQVIGNQTVHYSDRESAAQLLEIML